jgi:hypothetical protein
MDIIWDQEKNTWLQLNRGISFEEIAGLILNREYLDILKHPRIADQYYFIVRIRKYTWVAPFIVDDDDRIVLKTAYPSRKFHKRYGGTE